MWGVKGSRHRQAGAAYLAAIALLFQALLFPGCLTGAQENSPEALFEGLSGTWICTVQRGDGNVQHPPGGKSSHNHGPCCFSSSCCSAVLAGGSAAIEVKSSSRQIFALESWSPPAGISAAAPRNRGPPSLS